MTAREALKRTAENQGGRALYGEAQQAIAVAVTNGKDNVLFPYPKDDIISAYACRSLLQLDGYGVAFHPGVLGDSKHFLHIGWGWENIRDG
jgi:hypothetical protein